MHWEAFLGIFYFRVWLKEMTAHMYNLTIANNIIWMNNHNINTTPLFMKIFLTKQLNHKPPSWCLIQSYMQMTNTNTIFHHFSNTRWILLDYTPVKTYCHTIGSTIVSKHVAYFVETLNIWRHALGSLSSHKKLIFFPGIIVNLYYVGSKNIDIEGLVTKIETSVSKGTRIFLYIFNINYFEYRSLVDFHTYI